MENQFVGHFKIWGTVFLAELAAWNIQDVSARQFERLISMQQESDDSADRAAQREGGVIVRRFLVVATVFAIVIAPFIFAWTNVDISVSRETEGFLGMFKTVKWEGIKGFVILPEIRQTALAIVGFYFGSSQIK